MRRIARADGKSAARPPEPRVVESAEAAFLKGLAERAAPLGIEIGSYALGRPISITRGHERIRIAARNYFYAEDMVNRFAYYFSIVKPARRGALRIADYSRPSFHLLRNLNRRFWFTSLPEGWEEAQVYIDYLSPKAGEVVLDLGAYCGLSAALFSEAVGPTGRVISLEPDPENIEALRRNLAGDDYGNVTVVPAAICDAPGSLWFSCEGNMGSRVIEDPSQNRDRLVEVRGVTLDGILEEFGLDNVDVVKMDIEGAEYEVLERGVHFLRGVRARWFVEAHADPSVGGDINIPRIRRAFEAGGYMVHQLSSRPEEGCLPLLYAEPIRGWPFPLA